MEYCIIYTEIVLISKQCCEIKNVKCLIWCNSIINYRQRRKNNLQYKYEEKLYKSFGKLLIKFLKLIQYGCRNKNLLQLKFPTRF